MDGEIELINPAPRIFIIYSWTKFFALFFTQPTLTLLSLVYSLQPLYFYIQTSTENNKKKKKYNTFIIRGKRCPPVPSFSTRPSLPNLILLVLPRSSSCRRIPPPHRPFFAPSPSPAARERGEWSPGIVHGLILRPVPPPSRSPMIVSLA